MAYRTHHIFAVPDFVPWTPPNCDNEIGVGALISGAALKHLTELLLVFNISLAFTVIDLLKLLPVFIFNIEFMTQGCVVFGWWICVSSGYFLESISWTRRKTTSISTSHKNLLPTATTDTRQWQIWYEIIW